MITLLTAGGILILCAAMIIWDKIRQRKWFLRHLKQRWGTVPDREYTQEELESISHYAKRNEGEQFMIDDITWNWFSFIYSSTGAILASTASKKSATSFFISAVTKKCTSSLFNFNMSLFLSLFL